MAATKIKRYPFLDQIEILEAKDYQDDFPLHLHDKLSLTIVTKGIECTQINGQELLSPFQSISLTDCEEIHANPNKNSGSYSFMTFYISPDVIRHFLEKDQYTIEQRVFEDQYLYSRLLQYGSATKQSAKAFTPILAYLTSNYFTANQNSLEQEDYSSFNFAEVISYIDYNFSEALSIAELARMLSLSKFSFIRKFKKFKGITPAQYITLRRIEASKKILREGNTIIDAALQVGFYDQSHMSRNFKKITGITPRHYQKACHSIPF